jgi:polyisoprenoid-binding protein YceI
MRRIMQARALGATRGSIREGGQLGPRATTVCGIPFGRKGRVLNKALLAVVLVALSASAQPVSYTIDPEHTHPTFDADHFGGLSTWHGLFKRTSGTITLDTQAHTGSVDVTVDMTSVDFGNDKLSETAARSEAPPVFETPAFPTARYRGVLGDFVDGAPTTVSGTLTLHGVTKPLTLRIVSFRCISDHPLIKREVCGADATGSLNRADYGITVGQRYGFKMEVTLRVQVEAIRDE